VKNRITLSIVVANVLYKYESYRLKHVMAREMGKSKPLDVT